MVEFTARIAEIGVWHVIRDVDSDDAGSDKIRVSIKETTRVNFFFKVTITMNAQKLANGDAGFVGLRRIGSQSFAN